jgi:glucokinase
LILAGDIGGTKTRVALLEPRGPSLAITVEETYVSRDHADLEDILRAFRAQHAAAHYDLAGFGIAGPVRDGRCSATNLAWRVDSRSLARTLALESVALINDLEATALGVSLVDPKQLVCLNAGDPDPSGQRAVIAAGTGLGQAGLFWNGREHVPFGSEGGHADYAPSSTLEDRLLVFLRAEFGRVTLERVLSGRGLHNVYRFLKSEGPADEPAWLADDIARKDPASAISAAALSGRSELASRALDLFVSIYGAQAGNFALHLMATGGVYLGGGIAPKIASRLQGPLFLAAFCAKKPLEALVQKIPVHIVMDDRAALLGAAHAARAAAGTEATTI